MKTYPEIGRREEGAYDRAEARSEGDGVAEEALRRGRTTQPQSEHKTLLPTKNIGIGSKIVIVGPGAMGCLLAAHLVRNYSDKTKGIDVRLLDKNKERANKIRQQGIIVEAVSGNWKASNISITGDTREIEKADLVVFCVKAYNTKEAVVQCKPFIFPDTDVLTLQNGLGNVENIAEVAGPEKVIAGVTNQGATLIDVGRIRHAGKGETIIGRIDGKVTAGMRLIREVFNNVGWETKVSRDIKGILWSKLIINIGINALTAITRLNNGRLVEFDETRRIMQLAVTEAVRVAKRKRIKLIYDDPLAKVEAVCEATAGNVSSMLQDILRGKRTEIDYINAVIVRQAQELGIPAPVNSLLVDLVKTIEKGGAATAEKQER